MERHEDRYRMFEQLEDNLLCLAETGMSNSHAIIGEIGKRLSIPSTIEAMIFLEEVNYPGLRTRACGTLSGVVLARVSISRVIEQRRGFFGTPTMWFTLWGDA